MQPRIANPVTRILTGALVALALAGAPAEALDLRSWDQRIDQASKRFVVLDAFDDEAVLDKETQLVWERSAGMPPADWVSASRRCVRLTLGGRKGWRLPTVQELASLVASQPAPALSLPVGHPFQSVQHQSHNYWTATAGSCCLGNYWTVGFVNSGLLTEIAGNGQQFHWCVRGGSGVETQ